MSGVKSKGMPAFRDNASMAEGGKKVESQPAIGRFVVSRRHW